MRICTGPQQHVVEMQASVTLSALAMRLGESLDSDLDRPWCKHRLYEEVVLPHGWTDRENMLLVTERAADELVAAGRARREYISAIGIGVHCEDSLYWSPKANRSALADFGPEFESPTVLRRLASHFQCHGL